MPGSSLVQEPKATLLKLIMLSIVLVLFSTFLTGNFGLCSIALWGVCGFAFGATTFNILWRLYVPIPAAQYDLGGTRIAHLLADPVLSNPASHSIEPEPLTCFVACAPEDTLAYCTPLEMLNKMSSKTDASEYHDLQTMFATVVEGSEDNSAFSTSPFTSPPMYAMEIFVRKEETILYEDAINYIPSGTASPLIQGRGVPYVPGLSLAGLIRYCDAAIMESNMRDMEFL
ncbi:hypothetical protein OPQ81_001481 [Rhizoctonia solani]|nr:hypothetical protein OPQ81_001481 [Rhizoctonia solani]